MDTPEQELDKLTTAINALAPKVLGARGSVAIYEAGGFLSRAQELSHQGEQEPFSSYLRDRTPEYKRQTAYDCISVNRRVKDTPLKQHLARIERTGSVELSKPESIPQPLFEEIIMPDVLKRLEDPNVYLSTGDIRKIIRAHKGPRPGPRKKEDNEERPQEPPVCDNPSAVLKAIACHEVADDVIRGVEGMPALPSTPEALVALINEVSGLVDVRYPNQEHITKLEWYIAYSKKALELINAATV